MPLKFEGDQRGKGCSPGVTMVWQERSQVLGACSRDLAEKVITKITHNIAISRPSTACM